MEEKGRLKQHLTQKKSYIQQISEIKEKIHQEKERQAAAELERQRKIKEEEAAEKQRQIAALEALR